MSSDPYNKTFAQLVKISNSEVFAVGDSKDHTFVATVGDKDTSIDFNFQHSLDGETWVNFASSDIQKTANGSYVYSYSGVPTNMIRAAYTAQAGGTQATVTVGTVVFTAVEYGAHMHVYTIETATGVDAGSETAVLDGTAILITGNAASTAEQIQTAISANPDLVGLITADSVTTFAAGGPSALASGDAATLDVVYKGQ